MAQPLPESPDVARDERQKIADWLTNYQLMTQQEPQIRQRDAFLEGYLVAQEAAAAGFASLQAVPSEPEAAAEAAPEAAAE